MVEPGPERSIGRLLAWLVALAAATASAGTLATMTSAFLKPHAFGGRDGQGAAGLAAMILLGTLVAFLVSGGATMWLSIGLHRRGARFAPRASAVLIGVAIVAGAALPHLR